MKPFKAACLYYILPLYYLSYVAGNNGTPKIIMPSLGSLIKVANIDITAPLQLHLIDYKRL